jgi:hypothetical protein
VRWVGHIAHTGARTNTYKVLDRKTRGKRDLERPKCRWEDSIKTGFKEIGCEYMGWIFLAQARYQWWVVVDVVMNLWVP